MRRRACQFACLISICRPLCPGSAAALRRVGYAHGTGAPGKVAGRRTHLSCAVRDAPALTRLRPTREAKALRPAGRNPWCLDFSAQP
ncbi:hypothetical protein COO60DRAFT_73236 [Scenedesmus sp. NREL 46B-D3]|nr:hypothetical protein COO60DRAFT_73236 [Scenedesmus sp. NREL 46B-D3]